MQLEEKTASGLVGRRDSAAPPARRPLALKLGVAALLASLLAGCVVVPVRPYYPYRPCCVYHPYRGY